MKNSMGTESQALAREARKARRASLADSGGTGVPFAAFSAVHAMIRFCAGQMTPHTFSNMIKPMPPPILTKRSEEHTSELQSRPHLVCRLLLEKKKTIKDTALDLCTSYALRRFAHDVVLQPAA